MRIAALTVVVLLFLALTAIAAPSANPELPGKAEFLQCGKVPSGKRVVKMNFKPESPLRDLVGFMSTISCTGFFVAKDTSIDQSVKISSPKMVTAEEAYEVFIHALKSVGLTIRPSGKLLRIVEASATE
jgi:hypothetical protein